MKISDMNFHEIPSSGSGVVAHEQTDGRTEMSKFIGVFLECANEAKKLIPH
jgi:hypothetical protein